MLLPVMLCFPLVSYVFLFFPPSFYVFLCFPMPSVFHCFPLFPLFFGVSYCFYQIFAVFLFPPPPPLFSLIFPCCPLFLYAPSCFPLFPTVFVPDNRRKCDLDEFFSEREPVFLIIIKCRRMASSIHVRNLSWLKFFEGKVIIPNSDPHEIP